MVAPLSRDPTPADSHGTTLTRLPGILSAGGGEQLGYTIPHDHPGDELVLIGRGRVEVTVGDLVLAGGPGSLFLFPRGCAHDQRNHPGTTSWFVVFDCRGRRLPKAARMLVLGEDDPLRRWFTEICAQHLAADGVPLAVSALLLAVLERLTALDARALADQALPEPVTRALRLLERHPADELSADAIAKTAGVSPSHLRTLFARHLGAGPQEHHRQLRLDLAAKLLRTSYLGVAEVGEACGWQDANYFGRLFLKRFGASPRTWRSRHRV